MPADPAGARPGRRPNRLSAESSPYLLQHAHNPVDWRPWGVEAFAEARRRDVPIFLSIGYSTCYWCHVMERESFEDEAIARRLNEHFVCVKVDREQRPDIDDLYMTAVQIMTGRGGWPMSVFLEPESLRPFWCGTYFPPEPRMGMPGVPQVIDSIAHAWKDRRAEVLEQARLAGEAVAEQVAGPGARVAVGLEHITGAASTLLRMLDRTDGGFGGAPKFPQPVFLEFLLSVRAAAGDEATRAAADEAIRLTLDRMAGGGVRDQLGGGFHRYSVDATWTVPHFEKMLYDNAQLAGVYARAREAYGDEWYGRVAREVLDEALRDLGTPEGGFSSALDAEVDGREGRNYLWTAAQVRGVLTGADADFAVSVFGLDRAPNFRDPHHPAEPASSVLRLDDRPERLAPKLGLAIGEFHARLDRVRRSLLAARGQRPRPAMDDKVLAGWNGLMIEALVRGSVALGERRYLDAARRCASFVLSSMRTGDGGLLRVWRAGKAQTPAFLEDYAMLLRGVLALVRHDGGNGDWLRHAESLGAHAAELFADGSGGYFDAPADTELFVRLRSTHDGALPSAGSVMLHNLLDLHELTGHDGWLDRAVACLGSLSGAIAASPVASINATRGLLRILALGDAGASRLARLGAPSAAPWPASPTFTPVEVYADAERIEIAPDRPAQLRLAVQIAPGYHINAADPGDRSMGLIPLRVGAIGGSGIAVYADYPTGEPLAAGVLVHRGRIEFPVAVELAGDWTGNPMIAVTFQACTDTECLAPSTVELDVAIDRAS